jgi:hypothetical protein
MTAEEGMAWLEEQLKQTLEQLHETQEQLRVAQAFSGGRWTSCSRSAGVRLQGVKQVE